MSTSSASRFAKNYSTSLWSRNFQFQKLSWQQSVTFTTFPMIVLSK